MRRILIAAGLAVVAVVTVGGPASATEVGPCDEGTGVQWVVGDGGIKGQVCV
jgi:hypothetical protein